MSEDPHRPAVDLGKGAGDDRNTDSTGRPEPAFDPYRFGRPEHPVPPEYAPPGYVADAPASPYSAPNTPRGQHGPPPVHPGQTGYGQQQPWMPPPAPSYASYPTPHQHSGGNGKAVAGLVLGIVSIVMCWLAFFNIIFLVLGLIFGLVGLSDAKVRDGAGRGLALAGLICTGVGFVATALYTVWVLDVAGKCGGLSNASDPGFSHCLREHV